MTLRTSIQSFVSDTIDLDNCVINTFCFSEKLGLKAELRNPDEFYHKMHAAKFVDGEHKVMLKGNQEKSRKLNEDRNIAIVNMKRQSEAKKAEKLKKNLHLIDFPKGNTKINFVSSYAEIKQRVQQQNGDVSDDNDDMVGSSSKMAVRLDTEQLRN